MQTQFIVDNSQVKLSMESKPISLLEMLEKSKQPTYLTLNSWLQGFPDNWTQYGVDGELISDTQRYKTLGNAVTTKVITHIFDNWDLIV